MSWLEIAQRNLCCTCLTIYPVELARLMRCSRYKWRIYLKRIFSNFYTSSAKTFGFATFSSRRRLFGKSKSLTYNFSTQKGHTRKVCPKKLNMFPTLALPKSGYTGRNCNSFPLSLLSRKLPFFIYCIINFKLCQIT